MKTVKQSSKSRLQIFVLVMIGSLLVLGGAMLLSIMTGAANLSMQAVIDSFLSFEQGNSSHLLVRDMRVPRAISGALIGAALAVAGALMQGMTKNPLADSGLVGLSAGAGLFLAISLVILNGMSYSGIVVMTFLGAAFGAGCVHIISTLIPGGNHPMKLVLAGATVSTLFSAISQAIAIYTNTSQNIMFWTMGNVSGTNWKQLKIGGPIIVISVLLGIALSRRISILHMGDEIAKGIGVNTKRTRIIATILVVLLSGTSFALCGSITFVGMMIPHFARFLVGPDYRLIIPLSAVEGAVLVVLADILSKTLNPPAEIPLGALISVIGVPIFLYYARKDKGGKNQ
ncbi:FecCD family ABC transporter permease [Candidatus Galacturonibacter soehngenii]|uniref:Iron ABC transporter permease n=1 Tax=Candidatus Galacturonatibacter soehngenii TaxID=2307010 RepID=A0A7V7UCK5_9FIRM|nr:iron ABC transporter permease [Candidatus Galacturonibacter soehngenii]KAB1439775.1 iron ABC transporter permease [Candidatus Galacturonibacter soehngenii]